MLAPLALFDLHPLYRCVTQVHYLNLNSVTVPLSDLVKAQVMAWDGSDRKSRLPPEWPAIRRKVMRIHRGRCHVCGMGGSDAVDHVTLGDDHSLSNLRPIHQDVAPYCHRTKSAQEGVDARGALRSLRMRPTERHPGMR